MEMIKRKDMELSNKTFVFMLGLSSHYGGNIIPSLLQLAGNLSRNYQAKVAWVFPQQSKKEWLERIEQDYPVYYTSIDCAVQNREVCELFAQLRPDVVHSHFSTYHLPAVWAVRALHLPTKVVWHLHGFSPLRTVGEPISWKQRLRTMLAYIRRYRLHASETFLVAVSAEAAYYADYYRRHWLTLPPPYSGEELSKMTFENCKVLINGIVTDRLDMQTERKDAVFTFMTFGGIQAVKRVDLLVRAAVALRQRGLTDFKLLITSGVGTRDMLLNLCGSRIPEWIELVEQTENISALFARSSCYVSTSLRETQSTAIAEATLMGLPVIQSDIPGTYWNARNPSTLLFRTCDVQDLADKMQLMLRVGRTPEWRERVEQTRRHNMQLLSIDRWTEEMINVYRQL